jgi:hypothetical protein
MFASKFFKTVVSGGMICFFTHSSFDLPDDVFQPGETRPSRPKKKVIKKTDSTGQKRRLGEMHVSQHEENEIEPDSAMISTLELALHPTKLDAFLWYRRSGITNLVLLVGLFAGCLSRIS